MSSKTSTDKATQNSPRHMSEIFLYVIYQKSASIFDDALLIY